MVNNLSNLAEAIKSATVQDLEAASKYSLKNYGIQILISAVVLSAITYLLRGTTLVIKLKSLIYKKMPPKAQEKADKIKEKAKEAKAKVITKKKEMKELIIPKKFKKFFPEKPKTWRSVTDPKDLCLYPSSNPGHYPASDQAVKPVSRHNEKPTSSPSKGLCTNIEKLKSPLNITDEMISNLKPKDKNEEIGSTKL